MAKLAAVRWTAKGDLVITGAPPLLTRSSTTHKRYPFRLLTNTPISIAKANEITTNGIPTGASNLRGPCNPSYATLSYPAGYAHLLLSGRRLLPRLLPRTQTTASSSHCYLNDASATSAIGRPSEGESSDAPTPKTPPNLKSRSIP